MDRTEAGALRVALAGAGSMARHHAVAVARSRTPASLVAATDPVAASLVRLREVAPGVETYGSMGEMLRESRPDVVHICTPPQTHVDVALEALDAGCHVYVEKPFAPRVREAQEVLDRASALGLRVCAGHQLLFERPARRTWPLLPSLGQLQHVESYFAFRPVRGSGGQPPIGEEAQLLDVLPHPVYVLLAALQAAGSERESPELTALEIGDGTIHGHVRHGSLTGSLVVTLTGRPVDNYLRVVGTHGSIHADFVRGIVLRQIGPGTSGIDKLLAPYQLARQLILGTTGAMARRFAARQRSYPGLQEIFEAFYAHIGGEAEEPVSRESILGTVQIQEWVSDALSARSISTSAVQSSIDAGRTVLVTGGTGFLGQAVVRELRDAGWHVRALARREPASWNRLAGVEYIEADLAEGLNPRRLDGVAAVVHCAAATSGGWREHQEASIDATQHLINAMTAAGCRRLLHVSSVAVVDGHGGKIDEASPYLLDSRSAGPYVWGKLESERLARSLGVERGLDLTVVRPGAIVDYDDFDPPGRLGKRLGNLFVAVGGRREQMGVVGLGFCSRAFVLLLEDSRAPRIVHLLDPQLPSRYRLVRRLKLRNPDLCVVWIPRVAVRPIGYLLIAFQKLLKPRSTPVNVSAIFANREYDSAVSGAIRSAQIESTEGSAYDHQ